MPLAARPTVVIRPATPEDSSACGEICYRSFSKISADHGFPCDFPGVEASIGVLSMMFSSPDFYCVVAEYGGRVVGSNALYEGSIIGGVGPITVDPDAQNLGVGRKLMQAALDRANTRRAAGVRLVQAAFHNRSLALYSSLGFDVREPLSCMQGRCHERSILPCVVRTAELSDLEPCNALSRRVHGSDRSAELEHTIEQHTARVVERAGYITGYATALGFFGHAVAETNLDMKALIASAESLGGPGILVPTRNSDLLRWCLANGLRIVQPMTLMAMGLYNDPSGAWLPSILY